MEKWWVVGGLDGSGTKQSVLGLVSGMGSAFIVSARTRTRLLCSAALFVAIKDVVSHNIRLEKHVKEGV